MELANLDDEVLLRAIARKRWLIPAHAGLGGRLTGSAVHVSRPALAVIRASTRLSQGRWLARLAATAAERAGGRPIQVVELGTCAGVSGMYLLAGMGRRGGGHLTTFEGNRELAALAVHHFEWLRDTHGLHNVTFDVRVGRFEDTVAPFFEGEGPALDLVFVDGHHQEEPTLEYHRLARARMAERGIVVHDDIAWSEGMIRAWAAIRAQESCRVVEMVLGGRPSRGVFFLGEPQVGPVERLHFDGLLERTARRAYFLARGNRPPRS